MYAADLHQIFSISTHMGNHDQSDLLFAIFLGSRDVAMVTEFWRKTAKNDIQRMG